MEQLVDTWPEIAKNKGYSPAFIRKAREASQLRQQEELRLQEVGRAKDLMRSRGAPQWAREMILDMSRNLGMSPLDMLGDSRRHASVKARNAILYTLKETKPALSSPVIGCWFRRDHVSVLYGIAAHAEATGKAPLVGLDIDRSRETRRIRNQKIAEAASYRLQPKAERS